MHTHFYHWHARAELKPETVVLEPRWDAAEQFAKTLSGSDLAALLHLALFRTPNVEFAKRFSDAIVKLEPTFPPSGNAELLRVMAAAGVYSQLETESATADALALGLQSANFPPGRVEPVCPDLLLRAADYIGGESERVRPKIYAGTLAKAEKQAETQMNALKKACETANASEIGKNTEALSRALLSSIKESHSALAGVIERMSEESQFLWWLIGRRSPALNTRRDQLTSSTYAFAAAAEAAQRVNSLPPPPSVECMIEDVLAQCGKSARTGVILTDLIAVTSPVWSEPTFKVPAPSELIPISGLLAERRQTGKPDLASLKKLGIPQKTKITADDAAKQYFRELVFLRALEETL